MKLIYRIEAFSAVVLAGSYIALATEPKPPTPRTPALVAVDSMVLASFSAGQWKSVAYNYGRGVKPLEMIEVGIGTIGKKVKVAGIEPLDKDEFEIVGGGPSLTYIPERETDTGVLVSGLKPRTLRKVKSVPTAPCIAWVKPFLKGKGYVNVTPRVTHAWSVDLDGNGIKETLVEIASREKLNEETQWKPGDYSALLMLSGKDVKVLGYSGKMDLSYSNHHIRAIIDLDADGILEVVTSWVYYEGGGSDLWRFSKKDLKKLASVAGGV